MHKIVAVLLPAIAVLALAAPIEASDTNFVAHLSGRDEVPANASQGAGQTILHLSDDGTSLDYKLIVANIDNVFAAHIHVGAEGVNGPVVAFLFGPASPGGGRTDGVLAEGTVTQDDLVGPLAGQPLSALVEAIVTGNAYVNVHTNDGVAPPGTGPGDLPAGEIRGQVR